MPDRVAFESLLEYGPAAWRLSVRMLGSEDSADDVVQEAFLAAMRQLASGHPPENTRAWFLGIVANVARKHVRSEMNRRRREMVVGAEERSGSPPEDGLPGGELTAALRVAMAGLEEKHRVPVALCCEEGLTRREAAAVLGIPERTVSKYVSDGLARLREALRRAGYDAGDAAVIGGLAHTAPPVPPSLGAAVEKLLAERAAGAANATQSTEPAGAETASGEAASGKPAGPLETGGEPAGGELVGGEGGSGGLVGATGASVPVAATGGRTVMRIMVAVAIVVLTAAAGIVAPEFFDRDPSLLPAGTGGGGASAGNEAGTADGPGTGTPGNAAGGITILSNDTLWRCHKAYRWNEVRTADGKIEMRMIFAYGLGLVGSPWGPEGAAKPLSTATFSLPPADWTSVEFDDSRWERRQAPMRPDNMECGFGQTYCVALIAARGKFEVKDPAQVREVNLSLRYYGGAVVYVNGKEVARGHVPADKPGMETPAEDYPLEAYVNPDGKLMRPNDPKNQDRLAMRNRALNINIPPTALRKGVNVLAVEIHRPPVPAVVGGSGKGQNRADPTCAWAPVGLLDVRLSASPSGSVLPNVSRPAGIQVWTCESDETITSSGYSDPSDASRPISIPGARNGVFSGRLVVSSEGPIRGLKVTVSDLTRADGAAPIPASAVRVRYAEPVVPRKSSLLPPERFDGLLETIPAEIPVTGKPPGAGAVASIWLTVRVPKDAKPGKYEGTVHVSAGGLPATKVPFRVNVSAWTVPAPKDFRIVNFGQSSPDSLAKYYGVPLWSDKHFELMGKSMALMAELNSRSAIAELCIDFYGLGGNAETMVRWIRQPDGTFRHDFTIFDKYLDLVAKNMGKPRPLRLACWGEWQRKGNTDEWDMPRKVSLLDPATGKVEPLDQPRPDTPEFVAFWRPVLNEIRKKVEARGWWDVTTMQHNSYCYGPHKLVADAYKQIWPDGKWSYTAHNGTLGCAYVADCVWTHGKPAVRGAQALLKPRPGYWCYTFRGYRESLPLSVIRTIPERGIGMGHDGYSDFGVDFFPVKGAEGRYYIVGNGRGTGGPSCGVLALLAPGPDGPIATEKYEMLREGIQIGEAILFLERAILENKIAGDLLLRVNKHLDERGDVRFRDWTNNGRFGDDAKLLELAGDVAAAIDAK